MKILKRHQDKDNSIQISKGHTFLDLFRNICTFIFSISPFFFSHACCQYSIIDYTEVKSIFEACSFKILFVKRHWLMDKADRECTLLTSCCCKKSILSELIRLFLSGWSSALSQNLTEDYSSSRNNLAKNLISTDFIIYQTRPSTSIFVTFYSASLLHSSSATGWVGLKRIRKVQELPAISMETTR